MLEFEDIAQYSYRCVRCGTCKYLFGSYLPSCPAGEKFGFEAYYSSGKHFIARALLEGKIELTADVAKIIYSCTTCGNCMVQCPLSHGVHNVEVFEALRAEAVKRGVGPLKEHSRLVSSIKNYNNPWMQPRRAREAWARDLGVRKIKKGEKVDVLYFVGCTAGIDPNMRRLATATAGILRKLGVDFAYLGEDEICCGSTALRIGDRPLFKRLANDNLKVFAGIEANVIVTSCSGCFKTLSGDYPAVGVIKPRVMHITQYLSRLIKSKKPRIGAKKLRVTYHDPCHLGRHSSVYDEPRSVIKAIPGVELREMERIRENSWCCGAGGGVKSAFPEWASETSELRIKEAEKTGAECLVTACPFCLQNLKDGVAKAGSSMQVCDVVELLSEQIK
jgi:heterodisulfide reductase subunit D